MVVQLTDYLASNLSRYSKGHQEPGRDRPAYRLPGVRYEFCKGHEDMVVQLTDSLASAFSQRPSGRGCSADRLPGVCSESCKGHQDMVVQLTDFTDCPVLLTKKDVNILDKDNTYINISYTDRRVG